MNWQDSGNMIMEEVDGIIRVYEDGHVERPQIVPSVTTALAPELSVTSRDISMDKFTNVWGRFYVPSACHGNLLPLLVYFHGGGFCVGSADWSCYHEFLAKLASKACCLIVSVNYRLAPENPLPAAYEDGVKALVWLKQEALNGYNQWWSSHWDLSSIFLAGDSAGANIAHNVATRLGSNNSLGIKGTILIQPFFGGETRTTSEKYMAQPPHSALTLAISDTYWRLALPPGTNRDHPWCNPMCKGSAKFEDSKILPALVCISEMDILRDRNLEFCNVLRRRGKMVECVVYKGVGHAFQVLSKSKISQARTQEMMSHIKAFIG